jgi:hypothetical protein
VNATELAGRLACDRDPLVAGWVRWAASRGRGEELRLLQPLVDAGLVEIRGDDYLLTLEGRTAVRDMLRRTQGAFEAAA